VIAADWCGHCHGRRGSTHYWFCRPFFITLAKSSLLFGKKNGGINAINSSQNGFFIIALYDYLQHSIDIQVV